MCGTSLWRPKWGGWDVFEEKIFWDNFWEWGYSINLSCGRVIRGTCIYWPVESEVVVRKLRNMSQIAGQSTLVTILKEKAYVVALVFRWVAPQVVAKFTETAGGLHCTLSMHYLQNFDVYPLVGWLWVRWRIQLIFITVLLEDGVTVFWRSN